MGLKAKILYDFNLLRLRYWQKNKRLVEPLYSSGCQSSRHPGLLICMCDGRLRSGGLGDRIHGILSLYAFCSDNKIPFKVNFCEPFQLKEYLAPNEVDWDIDPNELCYDLHGAKPFMMACSFKANGATQQQEANYMYRYLNSVVRKNAQKEYHAYTNMHYACRPDMYSHLFHKLFKPTQPLLNAINYNKERIGSRYISVTLRFQNLLGDFNEGKYPTLPIEQQNLLIEKVTKKIIEIHESKHLNEKILVTSDSRKFLDSIAHLKYVYTIPGNLVHMSYTPVHDFETHLKSFVDLMMLADAEKLYLLVTDNMFHSGFAESASLINNKPYEVIKW
ncbi:MAG: hypothetical protein MJZ05_04445 [Fibrobacter sp.]|nr:hypothetical protein [Fibrobacter sp.]